MNERTREGEVNDKYTVNLKERERKRFDVIEKTRNDVHTVKQY